MDTGPKKQPPIDSYSLIMIQSADYASMLVHDYKGGNRSQRFAHEEGLLMAVLLRGLADATKKPVDIEQKQDKID